MMNTTTDSYKQNLWDKGSIESQPITTQNDDY